MAENNLKWASVDRDVLIGQGRTAEIYARGKGQVLKLYREGWQASWAEHEAHISQMVAETGLPVPAVYGVIEVNGRFGILFERIAGPSLVGQVGARPWTLTRAVRAFSDLHLAMHEHTCTVPDLPTQRGQLAHQIEAALPVPEQVRALALRRLDRLPDGDALCHGDYHPDNVLVARRGPVIIDWGSASRGNPLADVAQSALLLRVGEPPSPNSNRWLLAYARSYVRRAYIHRYLRRQPTRGEELAAWRLPIAVARVGAGISEELPKLLQLIRIEAADD